MPKGVSLSSSAGAVSRCHQSGYKQKVFSPLTSSTGPSVGRRHRNAYSPGVTATVCHQSVRLSALPTDNASTRAQLRFIMTGTKTTGMMKYTHQHCKSFNFNVQPVGSNKQGNNAMTASKNKAEQRVFFTCMPLELQMSVFPTCDPPNKSVCMHAHTHSLNYILRPLKNNCQCFKTMLSVTEII